MSNSRDRSLPERVECMALQKIKARIIRQSMILNSMSGKEEHLAKQVVKYQTFLSHQMLDKIKSKQLKTFAKDMGEYCHKHKSTDYHRQSQPLGIQRFLDQVKRQTKEKINKKSRSKFLEKDPEIINFDPKYSFNNRQTDNQSRQVYALKLRTALENKRPQKYADKRMKLKGAYIKSGMLRLMEKADLFEMKDPLIIPMGQNSIDYEQASHKLKREKQRLTSVLQNHDRVDFKPIGNVRKSCKRQKLTVSEKRASLSDCIIDLEKNSPSKSNDALKPPLDRNRKKSTLLNSVTKNHHSRNNNEKRKTQNVQKYLDDQLS